jgi:hypothetical protein
MNGNLRKRSQENQRGRTRAKENARGVWLQLPRLVVEARAGLIPSEETDGSPPPGGLTATEMLRWYRGRPVFCELHEALARLQKSDARCFVALSGAAV